MQLLPWTWTLVQGIPRKQLDYPAKRKRRQGCWWIHQGFWEKKGTSKRNQGLEVNKKPISSNAFDVLQSEQLQDTIDNEGLHSSTINKEADKGKKQQSSDQEQDMDLMEDDQDDMDIGDLDLYGF